MSGPSKIDRRRFLKYAGATATVRLASFGGGFLVEPYMRPVSSDNDTTLEAEVMIPEADSLYTLDPRQSWNRVAMAFQLEKKDGSSYVFGTHKFAKLYSEFDVYRHNANYFFR
jgi:hypothetical protein